MSGENRYPSVISDEKIEKSITVDAPTEKVWEAWTTVEGLKSFFGKDAKVELRTGGPFEIYFSLDEPEGLRGSEGCRILSYLPQQMLSFEWNSPPQLSKTRDIYHQVVIIFEDVPDNKTLVTLTDHGFGVEDEWQKVIEYFDAAWEYVLNNLKENISR